MDHVDLAITKDQEKQIISVYKKNYDETSKHENKVIEERKAGETYGLTEEFDHYHVATSQLYFPKIVDYLKTLDRKFEYGVELACGTTTLFDYFKVGKSTLLELADGHFEYMKNKGHDCIHGDIENIPLDDKVSDITVACNILNVNLSYNKAIDELKRITKDDGLIVIVLPWEQGLPLTEFDLIESSTGLTIRTFNDDNFKTRFTDKGLELLEKQFIPQQTSPNTIQVMNFSFKKQL